MLDYSEKCDLNNCQTEMNPPQGSFIYNKTQSKTKGQIFLQFIL